MEKRMICPLAKVAHPAAGCSIAQQLDRDASINLARNLMLSELPGLAFSLITLIYVVSRLIGLM